jgi:hypothetical protein
MARAVLLPEHGRQRKVHCLHHPEWARSLAVLRGHHAGLSAIYGVAAGDHPPLRRRLPGAALLGAEVNATLDSRPINAG